MCALSIRSRGWQGATATHAFAAMRLALPEIAQVRSSRLESFEEDLLGAVREREPGESVLTAFGRFVLERHGLLGAEDPDALEHRPALARMISESRVLFARYTASLAALIAEETGAHADVIQPLVAANAMIGVHRGLIEYVRRGMLAGRTEPAAGPWRPRPGEASHRVTRTRPRRLRGQ